MDGKLMELADLIFKDKDDIIIKELPLQKNGRYGSPQLLLTEKPSDECLEKLREMYEIRLFRNDDCNDGYKYLMTISTLRYAYEENWHIRDNLSRDVSGNSWDFDGYFYVTDAHDSYRRIAIIPYSMHAGTFDGGHNSSKSEALAMVKQFVKRLNNGDFYD